MSAQLFHDFALIFARTSSDHSAVRVPWVMRCLQITKHVKVKYSEVCITVFNGRLWITPVLFSSS